MSDELLDLLYPVDEDNLELELEDIRQAIASLDEEGKANYQFLLEN